MRQFAGTYLFLFFSLTKLGAQETLLEESIINGKTIYSSFCASCHMDDGMGVGRTFPPVAKTDFLINQRTESIKAIKYGIQGPIIVNGITYNSSMMSMGLKDQEIADVMNYMLNSWGNKDDDMVSAKEVAAIKK
ncbi:c-type cytochrome [Eudoraea chungangensis]|uniref:c-type cytochrome n=1 Tax=Eudoraea chungangensis TaxID=1481905 RepID=UPI0023EC9B2D|nr:cytochrome c [Eudoraea chungangensis]